MAKAQTRFRSSLREPDQAGRRATAIGWAMGAVVAVAVAGASFTVLPPATQRVASVERFGVDMTTTGSIAAPRLDDTVSQLRGELRALREELAALRAGTQSLSRRVSRVEAGSINTQTSNDALPQVSAQVPDSAVSVPGGSVDVAMRPMEPMLQTEQTPRVVGPGADVASDPITTGSVSAVTSVQHPFAIDIGSAPTLAGLDALWAQLKAVHGPMLEGLEPRILVRQTETGQLDLRLVAGPFADPAEAAMRCARLIGGGLPTCFPAVHDGQQLAAH